MIDLLGKDVRWDAILMQEGPYAESDEYMVSGAGHAIFVGACQEWMRSITIMYYLSQVVGSKCAADF